MTARLPSPPAVRADTDVVPLPQEMERQGTRFTVYPRLGGAAGTGPVAAAGPVGNPALASSGS